MKTPHVHADIIKAWADGAIIQYWRAPYGWGDTSGNDPAWCPDAKYRVKPEIKPDYTDTASVYRNLNYRFENERLKSTYALGFAPDYVGELTLTFDGETGKLKSAEVV